MPLDPTAFPVAPESTPIEQINRVGKLHWEHPDVTEGPSKVMVLIADVSNELSVSEWQTVVVDLAAKGIVLQQAIAQDIPTFPDGYRLTGKIDAEFRLEKTEPLAQ